MNLRIKEYDYWGREQLWGYDCAALSINGSQKGNGYPQQTAPAQCKSTVEL